MIITKQALPRRTVLRGLGAAIALPLLDGMVPALTALAQTPARSKPRLGIVYVPHGAVMNNWTPASEGAGFALSPILEPLAGFRDHLSVLTGLDHAPGAQLPGDPAGGHGRITGAFLTGVHAKPTEGADFEAGTSMDQIAAAHLGQQTPLASLEVGIGLPEFGGACDAGFSCAYISTLSWSTPTTPLPMESSPRAVFERLFGDGTSTDPAARLERRARDRSILDAVTAKVARLGNGLGAADRAKLTDYLTAVRDIERRIQRAEAEGERELPVVGQAGGKRAGVLRRLREGDVRPAAAGLPGRPHPDHHVPDDTGALGADLSRDRRAGPAPRPLAPREQTGEPGEADEGRQLSHGAVRLLLGQAARDTGRRRVAARPGDDSVWQRHEQQQPP